MAYDQTESRGRNTNSVMADWVDRGPWQYWDTVNFTGGSQVLATYSPFSIPIGAQNPLVTGTIKTRLQTNLTRSNQFPPPRCLLLMGIGFYFSSSMLKSDIDLILNSCVMQFKIDDKVFHEGLLWMFPSGAGLAGVTQNSGESVYTNGIPAPQNMRRYGDWAKYVAPLQEFSMSLTFGGGGVTAPTLTADSAMVVFFDGLTDRSVQ